MRVTVMPEETQAVFQWLQTRCSELIAKARFKGFSGLVFYYPVAGGVAYPKLFVRDFAYMYESAPEFFPAHEVYPVLAELIRHIREDGLAPECISMDGRANYRCHGTGDVVDSGLFLVKLFSAYGKAVGDNQFIYHNIQKFWRMLEVLPHENRTGLVWIDPLNAHTGYGFTDSIAKTGRELFCSLLLLEALDIVEHWAQECGEDLVRRNSKQWSAALRDNLILLWDESTGMFRAASDSCRQIDVWGSIYACHIGAATPSQRAAITQWLSVNRANYEYLGHLRHLPEPEFWQRLIPPFDQKLKQGECQNGTYWSTPSGWYAELLESVTPGTGLSFLIELVRHFQEIGIWECINRNGYRNIQDNLSSALLPYGSFKRLRQR